MHTRRSDWWWRSFEIISKQAGLVSFAIFDNFDELSFDSKWVAKIRRYFFLFIYNAFKRLHLEEGIQHVNSMLFVSTTYTRYGCDNLYAYSFYLSTKFQFLYTQKYILLCVLLNVV